MCCLVGLDENIGGSRVCLPGMVGGGFVSASGKSTSTSRMHLLPQQSIILHLLFWTWCIIFTAQYVPKAGHNAADRVIANAISRDTIVYVVSVIIESYNAEHCTTAALFSQW